MKLLALDTATEACSAALYIDGQIEQRYQLAPREHTQLILGMVQDLLQQAGLRVQQLDALAFGRGPGSFTGVRIATGVVQGLAYAADLKVVPVSTLAAMARSVFEDHGAQRVVSAIDARMGDIYVAAYEIDEHESRLIAEEQVIAPDQFELPDGEWVGVGSGWGAYGDQLQARFGSAITQRYDDYFPRSRAIAQLAVNDFNNGLAVAAAQAVPVYLRNEVAKKAKGLT